MSIYISSGVCKYGDKSRVKDDVKTLTEILSRQGSSLFIDVIAEHIGGVVLKFSLNDMEKRKILEQLQEELRESILERV